VLAWRDLAVRYRQTVIGVVWALIRPLLTMVVFTVIFGQIAKLPSEGTAPYALMVFAAMLPWQFFATALSESSGSLIGNASLISKVYFPRLQIPTSSALAGLVDFFIVFLVLGILLFIYGYPPNWAWLTLPFFLSIAIGTALGVSYWLSALNVQYRDVAFVIPFLIQLWFFATPIVYSSSLIPAPWDILYALNPMAAVVDGFRWALFGTTAISGPMLLLSVGSMLAILVTGLFVFKRMERTFADVV